MAKFEGFKCDGCWRVIDSEERTREIIKFEGARPIGTFARDLCPECVIEPVGMTRTSRDRRPAEEAPSPATVPELEVRLLEPPEPFFPDPIELTPPSHPPILGIDYGVKLQ